MHSGDLGYRDEDGILWFVGRDDEMIKSSGFRISPTEVEEVVYLHDGIEDAVAFGVEGCCATSSFSVSYRSARSWSKPRTLICCAVSTAGLT